MTTSRSTTHVIRVDGHLDDHWSTLFDGLTIAREADGTTTLTCVITDQAQLYGVLTGLRDIGAALLEVRTESRARPLPLEEHLSNRPRAHIGSPLGSAPSGMP